MQGLRKLNILHDVLVTVLGIIHYSMTEGIGIHSFKYNTVAVSCLYRIISDNRRDTADKGCLCIGTLMFDFLRKVGIVLSFSADMGLHYSRSDGHPVMRSYRNGYFRAYYPELRLLYQF